MNENKHITKKYFYEILEKRLRSYEEAILGTRNIFGMKHTMMISLLNNIEKIKSLDSGSNFFGSDFWGYGINNVCNGNKQHFHEDVEVIKKIDRLNKHGEEYRKLWLLIFKVEKEAFFVSTFLIDSCSTNIISDINTKYELKDFQNAKMRTEGSAIYLEFHFRTAKNPISFQIDTYHFGGYNLCGGQLAKYYIDRINELTKNYESKDDAKIDSSEDVNKSIDDLELKLRKVIANTLIVSYGKEDFESLITGASKAQIKSCIKEYLQIHPNSKESDFISINETIQFCNIEHLKKIILKEENWEYFEIVFSDRDKVEKYFEGLNNLRKAIKHTRDVTDLIYLEGRAAIVWFRMAICPEVEIIK